MAARILYDEYLSRLGLAPFIGLLIEFRIVGEGALELEGQAPAQDADAIDGPDAGL